MRLFLRRDGGFERVMERIDRGRWTFRIVVVVFKYFCYLFRVRRWPLACASLSPLPRCLQRCGRAAEVVDASANVRPRRSPISCDLAYTRHRMRPLRNRALSTVTTHRNSNFGGHPQKVDTGLRPEPLRTKVAKRFLLGGGKKNAFQYPPSQARGNKSSLPCADRQDAVGFTPLVFRLSEV